MSDDAVAQFMAITSAEADTAQQYLQAADFQLDAAIELFFASEGASLASQTDSAAVLGNDGVRERIEGFDDQLVDEEAQLYNEAVRNMRRNELRSRRPLGVFNQNRDVEASTQQMSKHERRLANLFRPPFDLMSDLTLDEAKEAAQTSHKLVMVNVQDPGEFACQQLNRDIWRSQQIKQVVRANFVFLQFDAEDPDGEDYGVLYPFSTYPHIAIIDPWTGEQQKTWSKVPEHDSFIEDLYDFISTAAAPVANDAEKDDEMAIDGHENEDDSHNKEDESRNKEDALVDLVALIPADDSAEPPASSDTTRIQLKYGDGKRTVRRFLLSDPVAKIYGVAKSVVGMEKLTLTADRRDLRHETAVTIDAANLKNSTVLVELA